MGEQCSDLSAGRGGGKLGRAGAGWGAGWVLGDGSKGLIWAGSLTLGLGLGRMPLGSMWVFREGPCRWAQMFSRPVPGTLPLGFSGTANTVVLPCSLSGLGGLGPCCSLSCGSLSIVT